MEQNIVRENEKVIWRLEEEAANLKFDLDSTRDKLKEETIAHKGAVEALGLALQDTADSNTKFKLVEDKLRAALKRPGGTE